VVKGFDLEQDELILNSGEIEDYRLSIRTFERTWQRADYWSVVIVEPGILPTTANSLDYFVAIAGLQRNNPTNPDLEAGFTRGLEEWPEDRNLLMGYANFLAVTEQHYAATDVYSETINLYPEYGPAHNNMAEVLMQLGRLDEAQYHVQTAISLEDDFNAIYVNTLRQLEALQQQQPN
jgi:tetratricopeptide (TPR) repeat protein